MATQTKTIRTGVPRKLSDIDIVAARGNAECRRLRREHKQGG